MKPARRLVRNRELRRRVFIRGESSLWVGYHGNWCLLQHGEESAHRASGDEAIERAGRTLDGQAILGVDVDAESGRSRFRFDLGALLKTKPREDEPLEEQWSLRLPGGDHLVFRSDGRASLGRSGPEESIWHPAT